MKAAFLIILLLVVSLNIYVVWRMWCVLPYLWLKIVVSVSYIAALSLFFVGFIYRQSMAWASVINAVGSTALVIFLYALLIFAFLDLARLLKLVPQHLLFNSPVGSAIVFATLAILMIVGSINYRTKKAVRIEVSTSKVLEKPLKLVMASDLHLGYTNKRKDLSKWVDMINAENPDMLILGGDVIDITVEPLFTDNFAEEFRRLNCPVYAAFGNHEFYSGYDESLKFYNESGIVSLRDSTASVNGIRIIGRQDRTIPSRKALSELVEGLPQEEFRLLIDHQPYQLEEAEHEGIDFQFSGHTHKAQLWPLSWVVQLMYEKAYGSYKRGSTEYYISSGLGIWGPKYRIGTQSEYVVLSIKSEIQEVV